MPLKIDLLRFNSGKLNDQRVLQDYELSDRSEIEISVRSSPTTSSSTGSENASSAKKLRVTTLTKCGTQKISERIEGRDSVHTFSGGFGMILILKVAVERNQWASILQASAHCSGRTRRIQ
ncbi:hypothetical protein U1Q18_029221 [Sarracenia purpurea var. burkii]